METLRLAQKTQQPVLALGAFLKNTIGLWHEDKFYFSPIHGDLGTPEARQALDLSVDAFLELLAKENKTLGMVAHDLHPDFYSTQVAQALAAKYDIPCIAIQHHEAHIASIQAELGQVSPMIGVAMDGVGLGHDGTVWGGELLLCSPNKAQRLGHLSPLAMPGGDIAARESWRMAVSALYTSNLLSQAENIFALSVEPKKIQALSTILAKQINCPMSSSAGRWFDAIAALLGFNVTQAFEAQAAISLEKAAQGLLDSWSQAQIDAFWHQVSEPIFAFDQVNDCLSLQDEVPVICDYAINNALDLGALYFHFALAARWIRAVYLTSQTYQINDVALSGGCFLNSILRQRMLSGLTQLSLTVHLPVKHHCGDAGLSLGQAWIAANRYDSVIM